MRATAEVGGTWPQVRHTAFQSKMALRKTLDQLAQAAQEMQGSIESLVQELRCFDISAQPAAADTYEDTEIKY